ncbi:protein-serine/threonine phosphatase [Leptolyngbya boryana NIES-2135]|jgi:serine/threonine protein phosphatase PrpC|uniref:Protein-serine/threonine phosphatase n=1 Tax=Leptolyngbya boryana NIES-2135 TaxID=1973484 RepID=A0A1Z4JBK2_LEPBY|nr:MULTISPECIES: protein phosphatase 2C domain-containing protein [Leptolyngbya]BAY54154.1 protein-serine/threonine phosphatase [Leptolyngbya boryana NIES-2135]MBD2371013.1 protein phosphatase 2C domain-containing protein [Leptolyngbya sp. FACHB-161]MBD2377529.1 protein phosphatase 2C domain-containing protein [Leptolyngbya sp. FACHB-238]MBD2401937.1 protein phosphatase 2C domain-containing protein [Leptolyngbya sp. FACHB-239]MBD2408455.1 protein phosphatase 2C domain-containing protein [Lepto
MSEPTFSDESIVGQHNTILKSSEDHQQSDQTPDAALAETPPTHADPESSSASPSELDRTEPIEEPLLCDPPEPPDQVSAEHTSEAEPAQDDLDPQLPEPSEIDEEVQSPTVEQEADRAEEPREESSAESSAEPLLLEELSEPLSEIPAPPLLDRGTEIISPEGATFRIRTQLRSDSQINLYQAIWIAPQKEVWLREALSGTEAAERLQHEATVLQDLNHQMFPQVFSLFDQDGKTILISEAINTETTLADWLERDRVPLPQLLSTLAQLAFGLTHLHTKGWVHLGLRPTQIAIGKPIKIFEFSYAVRLGQTTAHPFLHVGYSSPDLRPELPVDAREDVYSVGAILYAALTGQNLSEMGLEHSRLPEIPGGLQLLRRCLGSRDSRLKTMEELHQHLLRLKRRIAPTISYSIAAATTIGLEATRTTNQDAYGYLNGQFLCEAEEQVWSIACIADGMGGMAAGEVASEVAVKAVLAEAALHFATLQSGPDPTSTVKTWVQKANQQVCQTLKQRHERGGCTMLCVCLINRRFTIAHVGDCRLYRIRGKDVIRLTQDHSLAMVHVLQQQISLEELRQHPDRSKVTRSLGERSPLPEYYIDTLQPMTTQTTIELQTEDVLLLCSDGLWEPLLEQDMAEVIAAAGFDLQHAANELINLTLQRGAPDNATVLLVRLNETAILKEE